MTTREQAKILDFGLAKQQLIHRARAVEPVEGSTVSLPQESLTSPGSALGTIAYMSPEQVRGEDLDARTDLFSFGAVLYEMATGQHAFSGHTTGVIFDAILNRDPTSPRQLNPQVPMELEQIISKALEKDRNVRYQHAADMRADLMRLKRDSESGRVTRNARPKRASSHFARWAAAVIVFGGMLAWLARPLPPPRILTTTQITHDGVSKYNVLTDGSRLYIVEDTGFHPYLVQASVVGGDTSVIPTPFANANVWATAISHDHSQILAVSFIGTQTQGQFWTVPVPTGTPRPLADVVGHFGCGTQ